MNAGAALTVGLGVAGAVIELVAAAITIVLVMRFGLFTLIVSMIYVTVPVFVMTYDFSLRGTVEAGLWRRFSSWLGSPSRPSGSHSAAGGCSARRSWRRAPVGRACSEAVGVSA